MSLHRYPVGMDCVWLASDRDDHLGVFIAAGVGPIPVEALSFVEVNDEDIESRLCQLPSVSQVQLLVVVKRPDSFIELAERGVFVYDWTDVHRTARAALGVYQPVAVPTTPIDVGSLPSALATLAQVLKLTDVVFAAGESVDVRAHFVCAEEE